MRINLLLITAFTAAIIGNSAVIAQEVSAPAEPVPTDLGTKLMNNAKKADPKNSDPLKQEVNPAALEKQYATDPKFSSDSHDQEKRDKIVAASSEKFLQQSEGHITKIYECQNYGEKEAVEKCRNELLKQKRK